MKMEAMTIPGIEKITLMSKVCSNGPSVPCRPNRRTNINPAMTGETEKGNSINDRIVFSFKIKFCNCPCGHDTKHGIQRQGDDGNNQGKRIAAKAVRVCYRRKISFATFSNAFTKITIKWNY